MLLIIFSLIQGFTEFLPISSQGHLILFDKYFMVSNEISVNNLTILAHFGSLLAILIYYFRDFLYLLMSLRNFFRPDLDINVVLFRNLLCTTIPLFFIGYFFTSFISTQFINSLKMIAITSIIFGILLYFIDISCLRIKKLSNLTHRSAILIGCIQSIALIPGSSRSGLIITCMRFLGYSRVDSTKYSLLCSAPAILGATGYLMLNSIEEDIFIFESILKASSLIIILCSFLFSYFFIHFLISWVRKSNFSIFVIYRVMFGILLLSLSFYANL